MLPSLKLKLTYDIERDFVPVSFGVCSRWCWWRIRRAGGDVADVIALDKRSPGKLSFDSSGSGGGTHLAGELFNMQAGTSCCCAVQGQRTGHDRPARRAGAVHVQRCAHRPAADQGRQGEGHRRGERERPPCCPTCRRWPSLDWPNEAYSWAGFLAPAGTPKDMVQRLSCRHQQGAERPAGQAAPATTPVPKPAPTHARGLREDAARRDRFKWTKVVRTADIKVDGCSMPVTRDQTAARARLVRPAGRPVLVLTISNPAARNAMHPSLYRARRSTPCDARRTTARCAPSLLTGEGDHFCGGGDLKRTGGPARLAARAQAAHLDVLHDWVMAMHDAPQPVIAAVEGAAAGGGFSVCLGCDLIVAAEDAKFVMSYVKLALTPDGGGSDSLTRALPPQMALELLLDGGACRPERLHALGVVNRVVPHGEAFATAHGLGAAAGRRPRRRAGAHQATGARGPRALAPGPARCRARRLCRQPLQRRLRRGHRILPEPRAPRLSQALPFLTCKASHVRPARMPPSTRNPLPSSAPPRTSTRSAAGRSTTCSKHGFGGRIYPINPAREEVQGLKSYASLAALPEARPGDGDRRRRQGGRCGLAHARRAA